MTNDTPKVFRVYARQSNFDLSIANPTEWTNIEETIGKSDPNTLKRIEQAFTDHRAYLWGAW